MTASALTNNLFKPLKVGEITLAQRIAMAPLTRERARVADSVPTDIMTTYYTQRASAPGTLIVTEATFITERAGGYPGVPGIWSQDQVHAWQKVTAAVHKQKSFIFLQLWALGRVAGPDTLRSNGHDLVSASNISDTTQVGQHLALDDVFGEAPRPLSVEEIKEYVQDYVHAAQNAIEAGFDGIEIHSANGYLLQQFLDEHSNLRTDEYGGNVENRARFVLEVVDAIISAIGADRIGIRLSPYETYGDMKPGIGTLEQYAYLLKELEERGLKPNGRLAYIHTVENTFKSTNSLGEPILRRPLEFVRNVWTGVWIRTLGFDRNLALQFADVDDKLVIGFGKSFIANPDLVRRLKENLPLNKFDFKTFYRAGSKGYTDYPFYES
ncbi:uncharacterized protein SAPINGB_P006269 [Magnusiomyces paraingens]|uniref:NADH:flavin oxidoreductase/NADH oxidase N-terminal domain-containing protein n=1 Tax=Magnusiomyces paraingens TaxID=2606893 RepID=A0A5E8C992_9ASCO|nr:uncharacterized protein SAPINGB_P006269 [Saprochaete ingens]VVT58558.1 unnamed protein product [Saprochaete ingens]